MKTRHLEKVSADFVRGDLAATRAGDVIEISYVQRYWVV